MFYGKKKFPLWATLGGLVLVVLVGFLSGYAGYTLYHNFTAPAPQKPDAPRPDTEPEKPAEPADTLPGTSDIPSPLPPAERPEPPQPFPVTEKVRNDQLWIHIDKSSYRMYLYRGKKLQKSYDIAVGANGGQKQRVGDSRTPTGTFTVQQIQNSASWTYDFRDGRGPTPGAYGPWFIRLRTPGWSGIGIHGTHDPGSIGTRITQGCIRMRNRELEELRKRVSIGMKVVISE